MVPLFHLAGPEAPGCAEFGNLFEEIIMDVEEKGELRCKRIHLETGFHGRLDVRQPVIEREGQFLDCRRACFPDVIYPLMLIGCHFGT